MKMGTITASGGGSYPPPGTYRCKLKAIETQDSQYNEAGQFRWIWTATAVIDADSDDCDSQIGEEIWGYSNVIENGYGPRSKTRHFMEAHIGHELTEGEDVDSSDLIGKTVKVTVVETGRLEDGTIKTGVSKDGVRAFKSAKAKPAPEPDDEDDEF